MKALFLLVAVAVCVGCGGDDFTGSAGSAAAGGFGSIGGSAGSGGSGGSAGAGTGGTGGTAGSTGTGGVSGTGGQGTGGSAGASGTGATGGSGGSGGVPPKCAASAAFKISALPQSFQWTAWTREFQGTCASCKDTCATVKLIWYDLATGDMPYKWTSATSIDVWLETKTPDFIINEGPCGAEKDCTIIAYESPWPMSFNLAPTKTGWKVSKVSYAGHVSPDIITTPAAQFPYGAAETMTSAENADLYPLLTALEFACP